MGALIDSRRIETDKRLSNIANLLQDAAKIADEKGCVYATGSFGRGEASQYSDLDLFIVGRTVDGRLALGNLDEICIKAELVEATRRLGIPDFSGDGEYLMIMRSKSWSTRSVHLQMTQEILLRPVYFFC